MFSASSMSESHSRQGPTIPSSSEVPKTAYPSGLKLTSLEGEGNNNMHGTGHVLVDHGSSFASSQERLETVGANPIPPLPNPIKHGDPSMLPPTLVTSVIEINLNNSASSSPTNNQRVMEEDTDSLQSATQLSFS